MAIAEDSGHTLVSPVEDEVAPLLGSTYAFFPTHFEHLDDTASEAYFLDMLASPLGSDTYVLGHMQCLTHIG